MTDNLTDNFKKYRKIQIAEMRPLVEFEEITYITGDAGRSTNVGVISISEVDAKNGSPRIGDMIARNPDNHNDQWLVSKEFFEKNYEPVD